MATLKNERNNTMETKKERWTEKERKTLRNLLDHHSMKMYTSKQDDELVSKIEFYSDLGKDFIMTIFWDGTAKGFTNSIKQFSETFDPYEHAAEYINMNYCQRTQLQVPDDNEALIKDALDIQKEIQKFAQELNKHFTKK